MKRFLFNRWWAGVLTATLLVNPAWGRGFGGGSRGGGGSHGGASLGGGARGGASHAGASIGGGARGGGARPSANVGGGARGGGAHAGANFRGGSQGGGAFGGGGFAGGSSRGGIGGGAGASGGGFRPGSASRPSISNSPSPNINRPAGNFGGRPAAGGGIQRPNVVHSPGSGGSGIQMGGRPEIRPGGGMTRPDLTPGNRPQIGSGGMQRPSLAGGGNGLHPGAGSSGSRLPFNTFPGAGGGGERFPTGMRPGQGGSGQDRPGQGGPGDRLPGMRPGQDGGGERLPGLRPGQGGSGQDRPGQGGPGDRLPGMRPGQGGAGEHHPDHRPGQGGDGDRFRPGHPDSIPDRHQDLANRFDDMNRHWNDGDWNHQHWNGPNGGDINHVGFWGPNGYWGHTGIHGDNGGYWGHTTGIGPNGAYGHTTGVGPNGAVWGHGGAIGPNGAFGYAGAAGPPGHWSRNWGGWYNGYSPTWGNGSWNYLWNSYPTAMAFGATMWGVNAVNWAFGVGGYYNPYCDSPVYVNNQQVISYTQPIVGDPDYEDQYAYIDDTTASSNPASDPLTAEFDQARQAFFSGQYSEALDLTNQALLKAPRDAAINEFRSLCLYALGQYRESAATIHAVLAAGPGWDWTTMISLYSNKDTYTDQLRKLEAAVQANPQAADARFLLAYHYLTAGYKEEAVAMLQEVVKMQPKDDLSAQLVQMYSPVPDEPTKTAEAALPDVQKPAYPMEKLYGDWVAKSNSGEFSLHLGDNDEFDWSFTREQQPQAVSGAYVVRGNNLVMQPDSGGTMLSTITLQNDQTLEFIPIGGGEKLTFTKKGA